jgi:hypothetical protein
MFCVTMRDPAGGANKGHAQLSGSLKNLEESELKRTDALGAITAMPGG